MTTSNSTASGTLAPLCATRLRKVARAGEACAAADHLRQRIRLLTRLNRLTKANPVEVIDEKGSSANIELIGILRELAARSVENKNSGVKQASP